jgi:diguanylate cyclase (GGDEF)-like protein
MSGPLDRLRASAALMGHVQAPAVATAPGKPARIEKASASAPVTETAAHPASHASPAAADLPQPEPAAPEAAKPPAARLPAAASSLQPSSPEIGDPAGTLLPAAEIACAMLSTSLAWSAVLAAGAIPGVPAYGSEWLLPLGVAGGLAALGQAGLAVRRWRKGLAALKAVEESARRKGVTDPLTRLANRAGYRIHVEDALLARKDGQPIGVVYIDLDRFKEVNDTYGHEMGDKLLCAVTARLAEIAAGRAIGARLGGDEFALVVIGCADADEIVALGEEISKKLGLPFGVDGVELGIGGSVGVAVAPADGVDYSELVRRADIAMYRAKGAGRGNCMRFDPEMEDGVRKRKKMEDQLRRAIERGEMEMVYQPVFASDGETIRGVEALVRWDSPVFGQVSPGEFIPLAEETGLIGEIGEWTFKVALEHAKDWPDIGIAINVSPAQFRAKGLAQSIIDMVAASGIAAKRIEVEVTEGVLIRDADRAAATIAQIRGAGMRVALDDFGTGFSSLSYLRRFQFDKLKIDQVFVKTLSSERGGGSGSAAIIHNVVALGRSLGLTVQAEGVETLEHHIFLRAAGCHCLQGYYFARPMPKPEFDEFLGKRRGFIMDERRFA